MPRIQMTSTVRVVLFCLPIYLATMLGLIAWKFVQSFLLQSAAPPAVTAPLNAGRT